MKLTSEMIKARAAELGIDCIAIGNIERFKGAPKLMSPLTYFPDAKSVIAVAMRIPRGTYRGIEEGTHWHNYTFYSYNKLNSLFRPTSCAACASSQQAADWAKSDFQRFSSRRNSARACGWD